MTLDELTDWLFCRTSGGIRWGLETTTELLAGVGDPHRRFRSLHIGGTNGKGSVAALCDAALRAREPAPVVGLYTSPHLVSFAERVRVNGTPVTDSALLEAAARLETRIHQTGASFFEATTAMAFLCFAEAGVETAVVEVGLGGRLDATNVLAPLVTVVTNVSLDHTEHLGPTLEGIAAEKAGIFKSGVPALVGETDPDAIAAMRERAEAAGAPMRLLDDVAHLSDVRTGLEGTRFRLRSRSWGERELHTPLVGAHQARNAAIAAEALALLPTGVRPSWSELERGFSTVRWPGRLQVERALGATWVFDVAHNPAGVRALVEALDSLDLPGPLLLLAGILADKEWEGMLLPLAERADAAVLTVPASAPAARRWDPGAAADWLAERGVPRPRVIPELAAAVQRASTLAPHGTVLVTGSVHTVGEAMATLGIPPV